MPYYIVETNIRARKIFDKDSDEFTKGKGLSPSPFPYNFRTQEELPEDDLKKFSERLDYYSHQAEGNYVLLRNVPDTKEWFQKTKEVVGDAPSRIAVLDLDDISLKIVPSSSLSERWEQWLKEHHLPHFEAVVKLSQTAYVDFEKPEEVMTNRLKLIKYSLSINQSHRHSEGGESGGHGGSKSHGSFFFGAFIFH